MAVFSGLSRFYTTRHIVLIAMTTISYVMIGMTTL